METGESTRKRCEDIHDGDCRRVWLFSFSATYSIDLHVGMPSCPLVLVDFLCLCIKLLSFHVRILTILFRPPP